MNKIYTVITENVSNYESVKYLKSFTRLEDAQNYMREQVESFEKVWDLESPYTYCDTYYKEDTLWEVYEIVKYLKNRTTIEIKENELDA